MATLPRRTPISFTGNPGSRTPRVRLAARRAGTAHDLFVNAVGAKVAGGAGRQRRGFVPIDRISTRLDGSEVTTPVGTWTVEVYAASDLDGCRWVQLGVDGPEHHMLTLRLAQGAGPTRAGVAIASWLADRSRHDEIVAVA